MAVQRNKSVTAVDIKANGACRVYYDVTISEPGEDDEVYSRVMNFQKSDTKPAAVMTFINNVEP